MTKYSEQDDLGRVELHKVDGDENILRTRLLSTVTAAVKRYPDVEYEYIGIEYECNGPHRVHGTNVKGMKVQEMNKTTSRKSNEGHNATTQDWKRRKMRYKNSQLTMIPGLDAHEDDDEL
jgi:hypothetical protein